MRGPIVELDAMTLGIRRGGRVNEKVSCMFTVMSAGSANCYL